MERRPETWVVNTVIWEWFATLGPAKWVAWVMVMTAVPLILLLVLWLFLPFGIYGSKRRLERLIFLNQQILTELVRLRRHLEGPAVDPPASGVERESERRENALPDLGGSAPSSLDGGTEPPAIPAESAEPGASGAEHQHTVKTGNHS